MGRAARTTTIASSVFLRLWTRVQEQNLLGADDLLKRSCPRSRSPTYLINAHRVPLEIASSLAVGLYLPPKDVVAQSIMPTSGHATETKLSDVPWKGDAGAMSVDPQPRHLDFLRSVATGQSRHGRRSAG